MGSMQMKVEEGWWLKDQAHEGERGWKEREGV
jgi:hypothetical protein